MDAGSFGKILMWLGGVVFVVGLLFVFSDRIPFLKSIGRLPGDFSWRGDNWQVSFPLATSLLLSVLLTAVFWVISWFSNRGGR